MRYILLCCSLFVFFDSQAQQINPVPDYVFQNRMSVGRTAVTDTAAYFSIGPRYGAIRGMMPPMVIDTANVSGNKRNGLLIFSIQKNKYVYWDSVGAKWAEMAGTAGTALTSADTANLLSTRAWRKKGDDSLGALIALKVNISDTSSMLSTYTRGSGTTNYLPKLIGTRTFANSQIFDNGTNIGIGTASPNASYALDVNGFGKFNGLASGQTALAIEKNKQITIGINSASATLPKLYVTDSTGHYNKQLGELVQLKRSSTNGNDSARTVLTLANESNIFMIAYGGTTDRLRFIDGGSVEGLTILNGGNVGIGQIAPSYRLDVTGTMRSTGNTFLATSLNEVYIATTTDAGDYKLQVSGNIYGSSNAHILGSVGINTTSPEARLHVIGANRPLIIATDNATTLYTEYRYNTSTTIGYIGNGLGTVSGGSSSDFGIRAESQLLFMSNGNSERMRLNTSGELLIATTTDVGDYKLQVSGAIYNSSNALLNAAGGETWIGGTDYGAYQLSVTNNMYVDGLAILAGNGVAEVRVGTTTDAGAYRFQVDGAIYNTTTITTGAPTSGSAKPWRLGEAATISPTSPNRTIRVEIDGTVYYIHAKTTND